MNIFDKIIYIPEKLIKQYMGLPREVYVLFFCRIINALGSFVFPMITLILTQKIGYSTKESGTLMTIGTICCLPSFIIGGKLSDSFGRKKVIILFQLLAGILFIICGFIKPSLITAIIILIVGFLNSAAGPAQQAMVADVTNPQNRNAAYSLVYMGNNIGLAVGPALGGIFFNKFFDLVFIGDGITTLIATVLLIFLVNETIHKSHEEIKDEGRHKEKREEKSSILSVILGKRILVVFCIIMFVYNFVYSQCGFVLPIHMKDLFGKNGAYYYGVMISFNGLIVISFTPLLTKLLSKIKDVYAMAICGVFYAIGFGMIGIVSNLELLFVATFIYTLGEISSSVSTNPFIANHTPASHRGRMNAVMQMIMGASFASCPVIMGYAMAVYSSRTIWITIGIVVFVAALFMLNLNKFENSSKIKV